MVFVENESETSYSIFYRMCIVFSCQVISHFCKISKVRVKANLFQSNEKKISEVTKRRLKRP